MPDFLVITAGVEAGKKAAGEVLALQKRVLAVLNEARYIFCFPPSSTGTHTKHSVFFVGPLLCVDPLRTELDISIATSYFRS